MEEIASCNENEAIYWLTQANGDVQLAINLYCSIKPIGAAGAGVSVVSSGALTVSRGIVMGGTQQQGGSSSAGTATAAVVGAAGAGGSVVSLLSSRPWTKAPLHGEVPLLDTHNSIPLHHC